MTPAFKLTERQNELISFLGGPQRYSQLEGGARSGKTFLFIRSIIIRALRAPGSRHAIFRLKYNAVRSSIWWDTLPKVLRLCFPGVKPRESRAFGFIEFPNGSQIWFCGLDEKDRVEKVLGQEYVTIFFNEVSQIPYASVLVALTRLAQQVEVPNEGMLKQRAYFDLNPPGRGHWSYKLFHQGIDPDTRRPLASPEDYRYQAMNPEHNKENLSPEFLHSLRTMPERQRLRFYEGKYMIEIDGALWPFDTINGNRAEPDELPDFRRIGIGVDPSGTSGEETKRSNEVGIIIAAQGVNDHTYILADRTTKEGPAKWGRICADAFEDFMADVVVAEKNFGGDMVRFVLRTASPDIPVVMVNASRGKAIRAEPVSNLYALGKVHHRGEFPELEDQMLQFSTSGYKGDLSPDRGDALVHIVTELAVPKARKIKPQPPMRAFPLFAGR